MGQFGPPRPPFFSLDKTNDFINNFVFRLGYPHAKFQNNTVIFDRSMNFPKIGQLGSPKPPFLVLIKKPISAIIF